MSTAKKHRPYSRELIVRSVRPIPLSVPMRAIHVWFDEVANESGTFELSVLGAVARIVDEYACNRHDELATSPRHVDLVASGWKFVARDEEYSLLVWSDDYNCPVLIFDRCLGFDCMNVVVGPASLPEEWWTEQIADKVAWLREKHEQPGKDTP